MASTLPFHPLPRGKVGADLLDMRSALAGLLLGTLHVERSSAHPWLVLTCLVALALCAFAALKLYDEPLRARLSRAAAVSRSVAAQSIPR